MRLEHRVTFARLKVGIATGLAAVLVGLPSTAQAEEILDLESLVAHLELNPSGTIDLRALTPLSQISSNPEKPAVAKSVSSTFTGNLDGGGIKIVLAGSRLFSQLSNAKIENLQISGEIISPDSSYVGALAGSASASEIVNVTAENVSIQADDESGILVGTSQDTLYENVTVKNSEIAGDLRIGGVVGNSLRDSFETVLVKNSLVQGTGGNIGGIAGVALSSQISLSQVESTTVQGLGEKVGGIVGYLDSSTVSNLIVRSIDINGTNSVGGVSGYAERRSSNSTISNVVVQGLIRGSNDVGGISGYSDLSLTNAIVLGSINGVDNVGGLAGTQAGNDAQIQGSSFTGNVSGNVSVGGLVGEASVLIHNSISIADVQGFSEVGGLVGTWQSPDTSTAVSHLYSDGTVSGSTFVGGLVGQVKPIEEQIECENWADWYSSRICTSWKVNANYTEFENIRASRTIVGNSHVGSIFGGVSEPTRTPDKVLNGAERFDIEYPNDAASVVSVGDVLLSASNPNFRIGENPDTYSFESFSDPAIAAAYGNKLAMAVAKSQSSVFINSDVTAGGVEVFASWTSLTASETGIWGQCTPGSLPYLRAIVKVNPCPNQPSSQPSGSQGSGSASLRANTFLPQIRDSSSRITESLAKMITSGGKVDVSSLRDSGFENLTLKVQSELNSLTGGSDADLVKKQLESILVNASFFDLGFQPNSKTFEFFGIRGVSERLIPKVLDLLRSSPDSSIRNLERIEKVTNRVLILDLISGSDQRPKLSSELVIKAGLVDSKSPHVKLVARMIARLSPTQVDTVEKLVKAATAIKEKAETRNSKLQKRQLAFAA